MNKPVANAAMIAPALLILTAPVAMAAPVEQIVFYVH
jgi:hypothetical protein